MLNKNVDETKLPDDLKGTTINNAPKAELDEWEKKILENETPSYLVTVKLELNPAEKVALDRHADDRGWTTEEVVAGVIKGFLAGRIGKPVVSGPSWARKVKAPTGWIDGK